MNAIPTVIEASINNIEKVNGLKFKKKVRDEIATQLAGAVVCGATDVDLLQECIKIIFSIPESEEENTTDVTPATERGVTETLVYLDDLGFYETDNTTETTDNESDA